MKNIKFALIGATGLVGRTVLKILEEKNLPISEYHFFASSHSAGQKILFNNQEFEIEVLAENSFDLRI